MSKNNCVYVQIPARKSIIEAFGPSALQRVVVEIPEGLNVDLDKFAR